MKFCLSISAKGTFYHISSGYSLGFCTVGGLVLVAASMMLLIPVIRQEEEEKEEREGESVIISRERFEYGSGS